MSHTEKINNDDDEGIAFDTTQFLLQIESYILDIQIWTTRLRRNLLLCCDMRMGTDTEAVDERRLRFLRKGLVDIHSALLAAMETLARAWHGRREGDAVMRRVNTVRQALNTLPDAEEHRPAAAVGL